MHSVGPSYLDLIDRYFPAGQQENAVCILAQELSASADDCPDAASCTRPVRVAPCAASSKATAYGLYGIVDACWDPAMVGELSPFTGEDWAQVLDPEHNVWMASVVWSIGGWRAWASCAGCGVCDVRGTPIAYPRSVHDHSYTGSMSFDTAPVPATTVLFGALVGFTALGVLAYLDWTRAA